MTFGDNISSQDVEPSCVVCGKGVERDRGFARINHSGIMVSLCCPLCVETFQKDPKPFIQRLEKVLHYRALRDSTKPHKPGE